MNINWNNAKETKPEIFNDYLVIIAMRQPWTDEWEFYIDLATPNFLIDAPGDIEGWSSVNDWHEGQECHVLAWADLDDLIKDLDISQFNLEDW